LNRDWNEDGPVSNLPFDLDVGALSMMHYTIDGRPTSELFFATEQG
jgi:hypothetical protein